MRKEFTGVTLTDHLGIYRSDLNRYCKCYNIDLQSFCVKRQDYFGLYQEMYEDSLIFFNDHLSRIIEFNEEFWSSKNISSICEALDITLEQFQVWYTTNRSSICELDNNNPPPFFERPQEISKDTRVKKISIQFLLHLYHGFPNKTARDLDSKEDYYSGFDAITGYEDFKEIIIEQLKPIVDFEALNTWKIRKPGGIILFGPPGCGKTFWASQIAQFLRFDFMEIPRSSFASIYVDGAVQNLKPILDQIEPRTVVFFDEFDSVASSRNSSNSSSTESSKVVNTLLQEIPKLIEREIVIIAATNYLSRIDAAVIRPGRFDLKIPIFPPNPEERAEIIYQKLTLGLPNNSPLKSILKKNNINSGQNFEQASTLMRLYSASLLEDFVDTLKRRLKFLYDTGSSTEKIEISDKLIKDAVSMTSAKFTNQDFEFLANFYLEVESFTDSQLYSSRLKILKEELQTKFKGHEDPPKPIGYRMPKV